MSEYFTPPAPSVKIGSPLFPPMIRALKFFICSGFKHEIGGDDARGVHVVLQGGSGEVTGLLESEQSILGGVRHGVGLVFAERVEVADLDDLLLGNLADSPFRRSM